MNAYLTLTRKELRESLAAYRVLIAAAVFLIAGISGPLATHFLPDLVRNSTTGNIKIIVGKQTVVDAVDSYLSNMAQLPMLAAILLAMGAVAEERAHGVGAMVLSRPIARSAYLLAKLTGYGLVLLGGLALGAIAAFYYIALLFDGIRLGPYLAINLGLAATLLDVVAITLLCSTLLRSGVAAGGLAFVLFVALSTLSPLWPPLGDSLPMSITGHAHALLSGAWGASALPRPLLGGLLLAAACSASAFLALRRQEV
ncbi:MAG TPA: ABC transporter permease subunit [Chloroflexota bacterium]|nr:ABC transporter permease subunit [Chloroflexota bacterium]